METRENHNGFWQRCRVPVVATLAVGAACIAFTFQGGPVEEGGQAQIVQVPKGVKPYPVQENYGNDGIAVVGIGVEAEDRKLIREIDCGGGKKDAIRYDNGDWLVRCQQSIRKSGFILKLLKSE